MARVLSFIGIAAIIVFLLLTVGSLFSDLSIFFALKRKIVSDTGLPETLASAIAAALTIPLLFAGRYMLSLSPTKRRIGLTILMAWIAFYSLGIYAYTLDFYFSPTGPRQWYALTPLGIRFYSHQGIDPKFGLPLKPANADVILAYEWSKGHRKNETTNKPLQFCVEGSGGNLELYESPFHPVTNVILAQCSSDQLNRYNIQHEQEERKKKFSDLLKQATEAEQSENYKSALETLSKAEELKPGDLILKRARARIEQDRSVKNQERLVRAQLYFDRKQYQECKTELQKLLLDSPSNTEALDLFLRVETFISQQQAESDKERRLDDLIREGLQFMSQQHYASAVAKFKEVVSLDPNRSEVQGWLREAEIRAAEQQRKEEIARLLNDGKQMFEAGKLDEARDNFKAVLLKDPGNPTAEQAVLRIEREIRLREDPFYGVDLRQEDLSSQIHNINTPLGPFSWNSHDRRMRVYRISKGCRAEKAGLVMGDIILEVNGMKASDFGRITRALTKPPNPRSVRLKVLRGGKIYELDIPVGVLS